MEKKEVGLTICFLLVIVIMSYLTNAIIITGKVSIQPTNVSVSIVVPLPIVFITSPENKTYLSDDSLLLDYSAANATAVWYNLDDTENITITSATYFNLSQGGNHIIYLYANNTDNNISSASVSFFINSTSTGEIPSPGGAPGGGGGGTTTKALREFKIDKEIINVMTKQGESFKTSIKIQNSEKIQQEFSLSASSSLTGLVFISEDSFILQPGEEKTIDLTFVTTDSTPLDVYTGNLEIKTQDKTKQIPIIYNVKSKLVLFDVALDIPAKYKEVLPGEDILLQLTLFNMGEVSKTDVSIGYLIKDFEGNKIMEESEVVAVETQVSFSKTVNLPSTIKPEDYVAIAQVRYGSSLGSSSAMFHVIEKEKPLMTFLNNKYFAVALAILIFAIITVLFLEHERKNMRDVLKIQREEIQKINDEMKERRVRRKGEGKEREDMKEFSGIRERIDRQSSALEKAYSAGFITRESYLKGKERLQNIKKRI